MNLRDYKWFKNPRGLHNIGVFHPFRPERYIRPQMGWAKFVVGGNEYVDAAGLLADSDCMAIIRTFRERMGALRAPSVWYENYREYINNGCYWFEFYNEPNLEGEWPQDAPGGGPSTYVSWDNDGLIETLMDNWIEWAQEVIELGGYPAFPAMADSAEHRHATVYWLDACLRYLRDHHNGTFLRVVANGLWCATHPYLANHFYQEPAGGPPHIARPYYQQRANGAGWHFEYPYDPLQQYNDPGRTVFGGTDLTPFGDPNGLIASGQAFQELLKKHFDSGPVPVIGTEGGVWKIPFKEDEPHLIDDRYPPYSYESHAEVTMAMWRWIVEQGPPWFWGLTLWNESDYYDIQGTVPAIDRMVEEDPVLIEVADIDTGGGVVWEPGVDLAEEPEIVVEPGPAPVRGEPDYHWLLLAPGLQADWFFLAAQRYWQTFRPTVLTTWGLIGMLPGNKSVAVTVLARPDTLEYMNTNVRDAYPDIFYDPIVYDSLAEMQAELDRRATSQQRFG